MNQGSFQTIIQLNDTVLPFISWWFLNGLGEHGVRGYSGIRWSDAFPIWTGRYSHRMRRGQKRWVFGIERSECHSTEKYRGACNTLHYKQPNLCNNDNNDTHSNLIMSATCTVLVKLRVPISFHFLDVKRRSIRHSCRRLASLFPLHRSNFSKLTACKYCSYSPYSSIGASIRVCAWGWSHIGTIHDQ